MKECMIHPGYFPGNTINQNDIAVCQIIGSITYNDKVSPVCLPFQHSRDSFDESIVTALGWGLKEFGGEKAVELHGVELDVINLSDCKRAYYGITDGHMCTYTPGKDACQMDSGGPAIWKNPITRAILPTGVIVLCLCRSETMRDNSTILQEMELLLHADAMFVHTFFIL
ncbi:Proclotting enzyme [Harpegnathos saltator]|uniref:Proclotting enzyme n=1 Tax=Harpegnathos saltator TaxID=610380 RepID=E2BWR3_HARSA|nr:Proclotting enzyme [Harpegnathos saltator]